MARLDPSVAGPPIEKKETVMLKSSANNKEGKAQKNGQTKVAVIKNGHSAAELAESGERWATHTGRYMTLEEVLAIEAVKQKQPDGV